MGNVKMGKIPRRIYTAGCRMLEQFGT